ncbi:MAG: diheme cytochrome c [Pseudomonadota bacterium]
MKDRDMKTFISLGAVLLALAAVTASTAARADSARIAVTPLKAYAQECSTCHLAYPPGALPARSWQKIMGGLDKHYGSDASLDAATVAEIAGWLQVNAGTWKRVREQPPEDRITRAGWFVHKHREVAPSIWKLPSVKTTANCAACHTGAEKGRFDDDNLQVPAGVPANLRRAWND